jgi:hypothetical protein
MNHSLGGSVLPRADVPADALEPFDYVHGRAHLTDANDHPTVPQPQNALDLDPVPAQDLDLLADRRTRGSIQWPSAKYAAADSAPVTCSSAAREAGSHLSSSRAP